MEMAANKYKVLMTKDEWEAMTKEQKNIDALQTKVNSLKKQVKAKVKSPAKSPKQTKQVKGEVTKGKKEKPGWLKNNIKPKAEALAKLREWNNHAYY
jgi:hypothetical protein